MYQISGDKDFNVKDGNIDAVREYCDLPYVGDIIEKRRINFINNMLDYKFGAFCRLT